MWRAANASVSASECKRLQSHLQWGRSSPVEVGVGVADEKAAANFVHGINKVFQRRCGGCPSGFVNYGCGFELATHGEGAGKKSVLVEVLTIF